MNEHRNAVGLEVLGGAHFVEVVRQLSSDFADVDGVKLLVNLAGGHHWFGRSWGRRWRGISHRNIAICCSLSLLVLLLDGLGCGLRCGGLRLGVVRRCTV